MLDELRDHIRWYTGGITGYFHMCGFINISKVADKVYNHITPIVKRYDYKYTV